MMQEEHEISRGNRPADVTADRAHSALRKKFLVIGKTDILVWHAFLVISLVAGLAAGVVLVTNWNGKFDPGNMTVTIPAPSSTSGKVPLYFAYHISDKLDRAGGPFTEQNNHPMVDAAIINAKWASVEPERGTFDWSLLDKKITQWVGQSGKKVIIKFSPYGADPVGGKEGNADDNDVTPAWVYDTGVQDESTHRRHD